jgi:hypothetical protein
MTKRKTGSTTVSANEVVVPPVESQGEQQINEEGDSAGQGKEVWHAYPGIDSAVILNQRYAIQRAVAVSSADLIPNEWNPQKTRPREQAAIGESLSWVGQIEEIVVRPHPDQEGKYQIIDGYHRWLEMDGKTVFVNVIHGLTDAEAKKLTIVINETHGDPDKIELAQLLADIYADMGEETALALPYEDQELQELLALAEANWDQFNPNYENSGSGGDSVAQDDVFETVTFKLSPLGLQIITEAKNAFGAREAALSGDEQIALGQFFEAIASQYLDRIEA